MHELKKWQAYLFPVLFLFGSVWCALSLVSYIHEFGHVFFAYLSFGSGRILSGAKALVYGGWSFFVYLGGALFVMLFGTASMLIGVRIGQPWIGAFHFGMAHIEWIWLIGSTDLARSHLPAPAWIVFSAVYLFFSWYFIIRIAKKHMVIELRRVYGLYSKNQNQA